MNDLSTTHALDNYHAGIRLQTLYAVNEMLQTATAGPEFPAILPQMLQTVLRELRSQAGAMIILKDNGDIEQFWQHEDSEQTPPSLAGSDILRHGITGWVSQNRQTALIGDTLSDKRWLPPEPSATPFPWSAICAPLRARQTITGFITVMKSGAFQLSQDDACWLEAVANLTAAAIENSRLLDDNQRRAYENAQQRAQAAEARYLSLFEGSMDPIILTDAQGIILDANRVATQFLGYQRDELTGMPITLLHPAQTAFVTPAGIQALPAEVQIHIDHAITRDKTAIPVEVCVKRLKTGDAEILQWIHHDISKKVELEKMREELMAMLVHDLQNPLSNVISSLELVNQEIDARTHPLAITILDIARRSSQRLRTLISSLLDISRLEAGQPVSDQTNFSPARLITAAQEAVMPVLQQRRIRLVLNLEPNLPDVDVDPDMITRVFINLLDNALRFTPKEQSLTITASRDTTNGANVLFSVADQGPGVPPRYRQAVFDKYYRIPNKNGGKGIGLGLAFCRLAVEAHGGRIWVDQAPGGGALFSFTLPLAANAAASNNTNE